jgi:CBS domain containing-hemolysin-like protein
MYHKHMAIVMDEYGWVAWIITLEDIIEEVFWEIRDETDIEEEEIKKIWENLYIIKSNILMEEVLDKFNLKFKDIWLDKKIFTWEKVGYVLTYKIERFPKLKEIITYKILSSKKQKEKCKLEFKILWVNDWKIWDIKVRIIKK